MHNGSCVMTATLALLENLLDATQLVKLHFFPVCFIYRSTDCWSRQHSDMKTVG